MLHGDPAVAVTIALGRPVAPKLYNT